MDMLKEILIVILGVVGGELIMDLLHALYSKFTTHQSPSKKSI